MKPNQPRTGKSTAPELEADLRTTITRLRVRTACQDLLLQALLPVLPLRLAEAARERLNLMADSEVLPSRLVDQNETERETALWIKAMREALDG